MFRYKSHKQAFIMTALVILLCLVCLTGSTLALFTSDLNDGTIGIITTAGDVEVDLVDAKTGVSLVGNVLQFQTSAEQKELLFEPGATYRTQGFKIKNLGNIPVNFRLYLSENEIKDEKNNAIELQKFMETFEIWITTDPTKPESAVPLKPFKGSLGVENNTESETYYLFVRMKTDVGNEFQGKTYTGIGVTVYAVQGNAKLD